MTSIMNAVATKKGVAAAIVAASMALGALGTTGIAQAQTMNSTNWNGGGSGNWGGMGGHNWGGGNTWGSHGSFNNHGFHFRDHDRSRFNRFGSNFGLFGLFSPSLFDQDDFGFNSGFSSCVTWFWTGFTWVQINTCGLGGLGY